MNRTISILLLILLFLLSTPVSAEHYILSNQSFVVEEMTEYEVKAIFLGRMKQWKNGEVLSPCYLLPEKGLIDSFFNEIVKKNYTRFLRYWNKRVFSGAGTAPVEVKNSDDLLDYLVNTDGAICAVYSYSETLPNTVRIITVSH